MCTSVHILQGDVYLEWKEGDSSVSRFVTSCNLTFSDTGKSSGWTALPVSLQVDKLYLFLSHLIKERQASERDFSPFHNIERIKKSK